MNRKWLPLALAASLVSTAACTTSRPRLPDGGQQVQSPVSTSRSAASHEDVSRQTEPPGGLSWGESPPVRISTLSENRLRLTFPSPVLHPDMERLGVEEVRPILAAFDSLLPRGHLPLRLLEVPGTTHSKRKPSPAWESKLSVSLSITVYFAAWLAPEPFFSKGFAAALTVRLALLVGLVELGRVALACIRLYQEAEAATSPQELEAASERFGRVLGGTGLRVLVVVASLGVPQVLPKVPQGGLWTLLSPLRHAPVDGPTLASVATAHVVASGTIPTTSPTQRTWGANWMHSIPWSRPTRRPSTNCICSTAAWCGGTCLQASASPERRRRDGSRDGRGAVERRAGGGLFLGGGGPSARAGVKARPATQEGEGPVGDHAASP